MVTTTSPPSTDSTPRPLPPISPWVLLTIIGLSIGLYAASVSHPFVFDDLPAIVDNPIVERCDLDEIFSTGYWAGSGSPGLEQQKLYRPLTILSFAVTARLAGIDARAFRLVNLALHVFACMLVYLVARRLFASPVGAGVAAILFAAHPIHTEAVTYISGRADLLAAVGFLAAWWAHLAKERQSLPVQSALLVLSLFAFAAGLLSKEMAITLPAVLILGDCQRWIRRGASWSEAARRVGRRAGLYALYVGVIIAVLGLRWQAIGALAPDPSAIPRLDNPLASLGFFERLDDVLAILGREIGLLVYPRFLSVDYSFDALPVSTDLLPSGEGWLWLTVCLVTFLAGVAALFVRGWTGFGVSVAFFFLTMLPVSNLFVIIGTNLGERILYLPSLGICLAFGTLARAAWRTGFVSGVVATSLSIILVVSGAIRTVERNRDYSSPQTLFGSTTRDYPNAARAQFNFGRYASESAREAQAEGDTERATSELEAAHRAFERVLEIDPSIPDAHWALGNLARQRRDLEQARERYRQAIRLAPPEAELLSEVVWASLEVSLALGQSEAAAEDLRLATTERPQLAFVRAAGEGLLALESGDRPLAIARLESALAIDGPLSPARSALRLAAIRLLARAYEGEGRRDDARRLLRQAVQNHPHAAETHLALAELSLGSGDPSRAAAEMAFARSLDPGVQGLPALEARILWGSGHPRDAIAAAEKILLNSPRNAIRFHLANWHLQLGSIPAADPDESRVDLEAARRHLEAYLGDEAPGDRRARFNLGVVLERLGQWRAAVESYRAAAASGGRSEFRARASAGELLLHLGDLPGAQDELLHATTLRPDHAPAWLARGSSASTDAERETSWRRAREAGASELDIAWARVLSAKAGDRTAALQAVLDASLGTEDARVILAEAELALLQRDFASARTAARRAQEQLVVGGPEYGASWLLLSRASAAAEDFASAREEAQQAFRWLPESPKVLSWSEELESR